MDKVIACFETGRVDGFETGLDRVVSYETGLDRMDGFTPRPFTLPLLFHSHRTWEQHSIVSNRANCLNDGYIYMYVHLGWPVASTALVSAQPVLESGNKPHSYYHVSFHQQVSKLSTLYKLDSKLSTQPVLKWAITLH